MGNKQSAPDPPSTEVIIKPRCVHKGCTRPSYAGFVQCLDHTKEAKRKQMEALSKKANGRPAGETKEEE
jgi:hypothetical protein